jgi:hypothetical protein
MLDKGRCPSCFEKEDVKLFYWNVRKENIGEKKKSLTGK